MPARVVRSWWFRVLGGGVAPVAIAVAATGFAHLLATWLRYGRPEPQANPLLDPFMPTPEVAERHGITVHAPAATTLNAARAFDLWESPVVRAIFRGRDLLMGLPASGPRPPTPFVREAEAMGWGLLADDPERGFSYGSVTKPWEPIPQFRTLPTQDFAAFDEAGYAKIVWSIRVEAEAPEVCRLSTETRVQTTDAASRARFRRYWTVLSVGILLIRRVTLRRVKHKAEQDFRSRGSATAQGVGNEFCLVRWLRRSRDPLSTAIRRLGGSVLGTYSAYVLYGLTHPAARDPLTGPEADHALPGDGLVAQPDSRKTFVLDIAAPPERVWPWLVQMGYGRAGWYTWWPYDNGGIASSTQIEPLLQQLSVGDALPDGPRAAEGYGLWRVVELDPPHTLVLFSCRRVMDGLELTAPAEAGGPHSDAAIACAWVFHTVPTATGCRLYVRVTTRLLGGAPGSIGRLAFAIVDRGDTAMEWTTLQGIKRRAEAMA